MNSPMGPMYYHASKVIEYRDGVESLVKNKKQEIEQNTGIVMHFTESQVQFLNNELRALAKLRGSLATIQTIGGNSHE